MLFRKEIEKIVALALEEDMGTGDVTTLSVIPEDASIQGAFVVREAGVICGLSVAEQVFSYLNESVVLKTFFRDGNRVQPGDILASIEGNARAILSGERVALNFLQHLSGVATQTAFWVKMTEGTGVKIVDTRKTTPGLRVLEKYAVRMGGGHNHRMNLSDGILIKDNHIKAANGITNAVNAARSYAPQTLRIEVETENLEQVKEALNAGADIIMLDNMDIEMMRQAVELVSGKALTEASGNMGKKDLLEVAKTGVNFISVGALTNHINAMDISLKFH